jgi:hypothetical protein
LGAELIFKQQFLAGLSSNFLGPASYWEKAKDLSTEGTRSNLRRIVIHEFQDNKMEFVSLRVILS